MSRAGRSGPGQQNRKDGGRRNSRTEERQDRPGRGGRHDRSEHKANPAHAARSPKGRGTVRDGQPNHGEQSRNRGGVQVRAARAPEPHVPGGEMLKMGKHKGEWMEIRLPDALAGAPLQRIARSLPLPPKLTDKLIRSKGMLLQGPNVRLHLFPKEQPEFLPDWMELNILYEDEFTLVVNKPAGIEVHPSEKGQRHTLANAVAAYYDYSGQELRIRHIHRIDKETTGPILYAKNEFAHYQYDKAMREKRIERIYVALVEGVVAQDKGIIDKPIGQDRHHSTRRRVSETGDPAVTHYQVLERFDDHTLVRLQLETGRTHQIRVHMSAIGHPLAGDGMYGGSRKYMSRQALHGEKLLWPHPWTGDRQQVKAPLPDDFQQALSRLRAGQ